MENNEKDLASSQKPNNKISNIFNKATDFGKKVADGISKSVQNLSVSTQKTIQEKKAKKLNPLFPDKFKSTDFNMPNVIEIVDDAERRDVELCEGAIGWIDKIKGVEVLHLYDEYIKESGVKFVPFARCDAVYCVDPFDRTQFINTDTTFERTTNEKLAELEHIAYSLGAKNCIIEIVENDMQTVFTKGHSNINKQIVADSESTIKNQKKQSLKNVSNFEGNDKAKKPKLKWFAFDENIKGLVDMRISGKNLIKSKVLELHCSTTATMSHKTAVAIDKIKNIKAGLSMELKALKEHSSKLIFKIQF